MKSDEYLQDEQYTKWKETQQFGDGDMMNLYYLTFGQNSPAKNGYWVVYAADYMRARELVIEKYGIKWAHLYESKEFEGGYFPAGKLGEIH